MINNCQKGKRVERSVVNWLKSLGVLSARRSEQYCGGVGDADVIAPDELPSFHLESKGTKDAKVPKSNLRKWFLQVETDSSKTGALPVIFHEANGETILALVPEKTALEMRVSILAIEGVMGDSFTPSTYTKKAAFQARILSKFMSGIPTFPFVAAFQIDEGRVLLAFEGEAFVKEMLRYEGEKQVQKVVRQEAAA